MSKVENVWVLSPPDLIFVGNNRNNGGGGGSNGLGSVGRNRQ